MGASSTEWDIVLLLFGNRAKMILSVVRGRFGLPGFGLC